MNLEEFKLQVIPLKDRLYRLSLRILGRVEEAEDTVQDALLKLWMKKDELAGYQSLEALAVTVTRNICLDRIRSKDFQMQRLPDRKEIGATADPGEIIEKQDMGRFIKKIIDSLPEQQKTILHLRDVEGYEYEKIAEVMDMNVNAIRVNLSRARKKVRDTVLKIQDYELARN